MDDDAFDDSDDDSETESSNGVYEHNDDDANERKHKYSWTRLFCLQVVI